MNVEKKSTLRSSQYIVYTEDNNSRCIQCFIFQSMDENEIVALAGLQFRFQRSTAQSPKTLRLQLPICSGEQPAHVI